MSYMLGVGYGRLLIGVPYQGTAHHRVVSQPQYAHFHERGAWGAGIVPKGAALLYVTWAVSVSVEFES